jgi:hypothetical protein
MQLWSRDFRAEARRRNEQRYAGEDGGADDCAYLGDRLVRRRSPRRMQAELSHRYFRTTTLSANDVPPRSTGRCAQFSCRALRQRLEHRRLASLKILDVSDGRIGLSGLLEGLVQIAEITACRHSFDGAIDRGDRLEGAIVACGVRPTPPRSASSSSFAAIASGSTMTAFFHSYKR